MPTSNEVAPAADPRTKLLRRLEAAWSAFTECYAELTEAEMTEPGVVGSWSVKDLLAHISIWEAEAMRHLPTVLAGGRPPRYAAVGGIDAFNTHMIEERRRLPLSEIRRQLDETHRRLIEFVQRVPADQLGSTSR